MRWQAEWGDSLDFLYDLEASGINPKALQNKPVLYDWMKEYLYAFRRLNRTRTYGMAPNPISLSEIHSYIKLYGVYDQEAFIDYILQMDPVYLEIRAKKTSKPDKPPPPSERPTSNGRSNHQQRQRRSTGRNSR